MTCQLNQEVRYRLLKYLAEHPRATQRELARELGMSVGKINYCLKALMTRGWLKIQNFRNSDNKRAYAYKLTPGGLEEKLTVTYAFLQQKVTEYDLIAEEIKALTAELEHVERPEIALEEGVR